ncbi:MAG: archaemetzincin [Pseudomonadota bacterium]
MPSTRRTCLTLAMLSPLLARCASETDPITAAMASIKPLFKRKSAPLPGDWLAEHKEPGQSYRQFRALVPKRAIDTYSTLRLVPIGPLSDGQSQVLGVVRDFLQAFFGLSLVMDPPVSLDEIPAEAQRMEELPTLRQLLTTHLLSTLLVRRRQARDAAVLGITAVDLWPGPGWNFVFGQASLRERVGVWSMARNGDADAGPESLTTCTIRTVMTATHETGHMFGIRHCIAYECGMNGSNSNHERDRQPFEFCPECQAKLWWTCRLDPLARSRALEAVAGGHGLKITAANFARQSEALARA